MKASIFPDAQKAFIIKQGEDGRPVAQICRKAGISLATYFIWKKKYAGLRPTEMKRLKQLEATITVSRVLRGWRIAVLEQALPVAELQRRFAVQRTLGRHAGCPVDDIATEALQEGREGIGVPFAGRGHARVKPFFELARSFRGVQCAMNSSPVQGCSSVGMRNPSSSRWACRVTSTTAASQSPME